MSIAYEWMTPRDFYTVVGPEVELGEGMTTGEVAIVADNGGGGFVIDGSFEQVREVLVNLLAEVEIRRRVEERNE